MKAQLAWRSPGTVFAIHWKPHRVIQPGYSPGLSLSQFLRSLPVHIMHPGKP
jgi:hypothetical protein